MSSCTEINLYKKEEHPYFSRIQCLPEKAFNTTYIEVCMCMRSLAVQQIYILVFTKVKAVCRRANKYTSTITAINVTILILIFKNLFVFYLVCTFTCSDRAYFHCIQLDVTSNFFLIFLVSEAEALQSYGSLVIVCVPPAKVTISHITIKVTPGENSGSIQFMLF